MSKAEVNINENKNEKCNFKSKKRINQFYNIDSDIVLDVRNLTKIYKSNGLKVEALKKINFKVKKGEIIAVIGPSGSGKTTLINCIGALDFPTSGKIIYNIDGKGTGRDIAIMNYKEHKDMRLRKIGLIFQFYNLFPILSAFENVELPMIIAKKDVEERKNKVIELLKMVGLGDRMHHLPSQLSGGEMQRVAIARSLSNDASLIIADEPTGELDTETSKQIITIFLKLREEGQSILMVTHNLRVAETADRILTLTDGSLTSEREGGKSIEYI